MKWNEFIRHPEVASYTNNKNIGKFLYGKLLHDILAKLNTYLMCAKFVIQSESLSPEIVDWFQIHKEWVEETTLLLQEYSKNIIKHENISWEIKITNLAKILAKLSIQTDNSQLKKPIAESFTVVHAVYYAKLHLLGLLEMREEIINQEYIKLLDNKA